MRPVHSALAFAVTVVAVVMCDAQFQFQGQPAAPVTPAPLAVALLNGIDDPVVVAELKLKDDQVKALVARRQELWDEAYVTAPKKLAETAADRTKATDELLKKTLNAEQYKRAGQLAAQSLLNRGIRGKDAEPILLLTTVPDVTLHRYPELAAAVKLTAAQKKQLEASPADKFGGGGRIIRMSKEQVASAKEFVGPVAKTWTSKFDPRNADRPLAPTNFSLLEAKDVRAELKIAEADGKAFVELGDKWAKLNTARQTDLSPKEADAQAAKLKTETEKAMTVLTPKQVQRLKQIAFQTSGRFGGGVIFDGSGGIGGGPGGRPTTTIHIETAYTNSTVRNELTITEDQTKEFVAIREAFRKDAATVLESATESAAAAKKLEAMVADRQKQAEAVLKADQIAKWKELVGEPFTGNTQSDRVTTRFRGLLLSEAERNAWFGRHTFADFGILAANEDVQKELKMDEKQVKKAAEVRDAISEKFPARGSRPNSDEAAEAKVIADRSNMIAEEINKLLDEKQAKRFREIMIQRWEQRDLNNSRSNMVNSAVAYPGVADAVKLTGDQKKELIAGGDPAKVLTDSQKTAIQGMRGEKYEGSFAIGPPGGRPFPPASRTQLSPAARVLIGVTAADAEGSLKLTDEQKKKLGAAREDYQKVISDGPSGADFGTFVETRSAAVQAFEKTLAEVIAPENKSRMAQLTLQSEAASNLFVVFMKEEVAKKLNLTKEQTAKLTAINRDALELHQLRTMHIGRTSPVAEDNLGLRMRDAEDERLMAVLDNAQKNAWSELIGEPLKGLRKTVPTGRGGFGGGLGGPIGGGGFGLPGGFTP